MYAYEFNSVIENGYIRVPEQYSQNINSPVKVIVLTESMPQPESEKKTFSAIKVKTHGFKFDREVANE